MIRRLLAFALPVAGRLSPTEAARFGEALTHGVGYIGVGPVVLLFNLPARFRKADREPLPPPISLEEINLRIREMTASEDLPD